MNFTKYTFKTGLTPPPQDDQAATCTLRGRASIEMVNYHAYSRGQFYFILLCLGARMWDGVST